METIDPKNPKSKSPTDTRGIQPPNDPDRKEKGFRQGLRDDSTTADTNDNETEITNEDNDITNTDNQDKIKE